MDDDEKRPLVKQLQPSGDIRDLHVPMAIELSLATSAKLADMGELEKTLDQAVQEVLKRFEGNGFQVFIRAGFVRPMAKEDLVEIVPRKFHMLSREGRQTCDTQYVAKRYLTKNSEKVTCRKCMKLLGKIE